MKVKNLVKQLFKAIIERKTDKEAKLYKKITKKSLEHKHTEAVQ